MASGDAYAEPCVRKHFKCSSTRLRLKVIVEGVWPEDHSWSAIFCTRLLRSPLLEVDRSELRRLPWGREVEGFLQPELRARGVVQEVGDTRSKRTQRRPAIDHAESVGVQWASLSLVVMGQKLCFIRGEIHVCGAF